MESNLSSVSENFRRHAGLPERKDSKPITDSENVSELEVLTEPEGGYGGEAEEATEEEATEEEATEEEATEEEEEK